MQEAEALSGGLRSFPALKGSRSCDVLIVGGGIAGLMTACRMAENGLRVILVEARQLGGGATAACMGMATAQLCGACRDAAGISESAAASWAQLTQRAVLQIPRLLDGWGVHCGLRRQRSVLYAVSEAEQAGLEALVRLEERLRLPVSLTQDTGDCPVPVAMAAAMDDQLSFEPLALFTGLIEAAMRLGAALYEYTPVRALADDLVLVEEGSIAAQYVVLATGWPVGMSDERQLSLLRQHVWVTQRLTGGAPCHQGYMGVQNASLRMAATAYGLMASACAGQAGFPRTEKQYPAIGNAIAAQLRDWSPLCESAAQCVHASAGLPLIGPLRRENPRLMAAAGLGVNGLTQSVIASELLTRQITGGQLPESTLFSPFGAFQQHAAMRENRHPNRLRRVSAVFARSTPLCPHMGCRMRWSTARQLWECPCHGATFTGGGECRCAPAMENAQVPEHMRRK